MSYLTDIQNLNDELVIQRCRLKMVRLRDNTETRMWDGVWVVGGENGQPADSGTAASKITRAAHRYALLGYQ